MSDTENKALIDAVASLAAFETTKSDQGHTIAIMPKDKNLVSLKKFDDEYLQAPERLRGTSRHITVDSFLQHVERFKNEDSAIFADPQSMKLNCVYSYSNKDKPKFHDHTSVLSLTASEDWTEWNKSNGEEMSQIEFAVFVEDNILSVIDIPDLNAPTAAALRSVALLLGYRYATQAEMVALSRGIAINADRKAKQTVSLASGEGELAFSEEHRDVYGEKMKVPGLFVVGLPVFEGSDLYRLPVRLRYRLKDGLVLWRYDIHEPKKAFKDAFELVLEQVKQKSGLPVFIGQAD